jgi:hypothetical protein
MVRHQTIGQDAHRRFNACLANQFGESSVIAVFVKNFLAVVATIGDVVTNPANRCACGAWHGDYGWKKGTRKKGTFCFFANQRLKLLSDAGKAKKPECPLFRSPPAFHAASCRAPPGHPPILNVTASRKNQGRYFRVSGRRMSCDAL